MTSIIYLYGVGISTIIVVLTFISQIFKSGKKLPSPPGTTGWPIIGETLSYVSNPKKFVLDGMAKYSSEVFMTSIAGEKMAVFCGPMANKCVFANKGKVFNFWLPASISAVLSKPKMNSDTQPGKPSDELSFKFLKPESIQRYVTVVDFMVRQHLNTCWDSRDQVKVHVLAREFMLATSLRVLVNNSYPCPDESRGSCPPQSTFLARHTIRRSWVPNFFSERVTEIVKQRKLAISNVLDHDANDDDCQDLLGQLIVDSVWNNKALSDEDIVQKVIGVVFAGFYPTSTTITFAVAYLAEHPEVYKRVLQEHREIASSKGSGKPLTWMDVKKMQYSWNVVCETMRLKPPIPGNFRTVMADFTYAGFQILKGCKVYWTPFSTHTDPKYFHEPEKFDPSRFEKSVPAPFTYVPFGAGSRMCAGKDFARILTLVFLHHVVTRFRFEKVNPNEKIIFNPDPIPSEGLGIYLQPHVK